jgi:Glycosyltransferase family 87
MAASRSTLEIAPVQIEFPARLRRVCFALCAMNLMLCLVAYFVGAWIYDRDGLGIPTDFISFWAAGRVVLDALVGQTGFLTAALIGGTLYLIPTRPVLAGICLGLLTYKPQFGLLFPIALIVAGHWRVFVSASVMAIAMFVVSWLAFGTESWLAFFHWLPRSSQAILTESKATWWKLQSIYSMVRYFGGT